MDGWIWDGIDGWLRAPYGANKILFSEHHHLPEVSFKSKTWVGSFATIHLFGEEKKQEREEKEGHHASSNWTLRITTSTFDLTFNAGFLD